MEIFLYLNEKFWKCDFLVSNNYVEVVKKDWTFGFIKFYFDLNVK